jgi:hypothetical protein
VQGELSRAAARYGAVAPAPKALPAKAKKAAKVPATKAAPRKKS